MAKTLNPKITHDKVQDSWSLSVTQNMNDHDDRIIELENNGGGGGGGGVSYTYTYTGGSLVATPSSGSVQNVPITIAPGQISGYDSTDFLPTTTDYVMAFGIKADGTFAEMDIIKHKDGERNYYFGRTADDNDREVRVMFPLDVSSDVAQAALVVSEDHHLAHIAPTSADTKIVLDETTTWTEVTKIYDFTDEEINGAAVSTFTSSGSGAVPPTGTGKDTSDYVCTGDGVWRRQRENTAGAAFPTTDLFIGKLHYLSTAISGGNQQLPLTHNGNTLHIFHPTGASFTDPNDSAITWYNIALYQNVDGVPTGITRAEANVAIPGAFQNSSFSAITTNSTFDTGLTSPMVWRASRDIPGVNGQATAGVTGNTMWFQVGINTDGTRYGIPTGFSISSLPNTPDLSQTYIASDEVAVGARAVGWYGYTGLSGASNWVAT